MIVFLHVLVVTILLHCVLLVGLFSSCDGVELVMPLPFDCFVVVVQFQASTVELCSNA